MPIHNSDISRIFHEVADLLEIRDANPFRIRAYRNAARTVAALPKSINQSLQENEDLSELPGIGKDLAEKIHEIAECGKLGFLEQLKKEVPADLATLLEIKQLGPKRVATLHRKLNIDSIEELKEACHQHKISKLNGFGKKLEKKILKGIELHAKAAGRTKRADAEELLDPLLKYLKNIDGTEQVTVAGSYRRRKETVGDLDLIASCRAPDPIMEKFTEYEDVEEILAKGSTKTSVRLRGGLQVDLRVVPEKSFGAALYYFTGAKAHNIAVRKLAIDKGLKINEYGVFRHKTKTEEQIAGTNEEEIFAAVDLPYIEPELREDRGEIQRAKENRLPTLINRDDLRGDLHTHTQATDGQASMQEMVEAARDLGYSYLAITEHSQAVRIANGFNRKRLEQQLEEIDRMSDDYSGFRILKGIEVDILEDGSLDLPDEILAKLDLTICSIHSKFGLSKEKQTERIIRAMDNPYVSILGHPSGRLINEREPYQIDMEKILFAAFDRGCFLELNAHPDRLDLNDQHCRMAKDIGVKLAINSDAHSVQGLSNIKYGIDQARRGWLEKDDVINTRKATDLLKLLKH